MVKRDTDRSRDGPSPHGQGVGPDDHSDIGLTVNDISPACLSTCVDN